MNNFTKTVFIRPFEVVSIPVHVTLSIFERNVSSRLQLTPLSGI